MILIVNKYLLAKGFKGVSLWPFVVVKYRSYAQDKVFVNHERIHLKQQKELLVLPFYIWYGLEFFFRYVKYRDFYKAYRNISFEREAYANDKDLNYLQDRRFWNFTRYISRAG